MKKRMLGALVLAVLAAGQVIATGQAQGKADQFYASSERFGYTGTVSVYETWADANSGRNPRCAETVWPQRDGAILAVKNAPEYYSDFNAILTNWFANNGNSPSDTNNGFFQLYDDNADAWQSQKASWSRDRDTFTVSANGRNAAYGSPGDSARLWNACAPSGSGEATKGTFLRYEYEFAAAGLNGVEDSAGFITNTTNASDYSGHLRGIFRNDSTLYPASNGYYVFDIQFNNISWAADNNCGSGGPGPCGGPAWDDEFGGRRQTGK